VIHQIAEVRKLLSVSLLLTVGSAASARELASVDALSEFQRTPPNQTGHLMKKSKDYKGHMEERLGIPTFLTLSPLALKKSSLGMVALPEVVARQHLSSMADVYKISSREISALPIKLVQQLSNGASIVQFTQEVNGIEVFRERANILVGARGELIAIGGYVSGANDISSIHPKKLFALQPQEAISVVLTDFDFSKSIVEPALKTEGEKNGYVYFTLNGLPSETGALLTAPVRAKPVFYRLPSGLVPAYYLEVQVADSPTVAADYYGYVVSAKDGSVLFRRNQRQDDQGHAYAYRVWAETAPPFLPYPGPQGRNGTPHPTAVPDGYQGPLIAPNFIMLQSGPISTKDSWLPGNAKELRGNNVDAYADLAEPDGFSEGDIRADTTTAFVFDRIYDTSLAPKSSPDQIKAAVTQMFYTVNWLHDWYYDAGFDEPSGNAQINNYCRGRPEKGPLPPKGQGFSGIKQSQIDHPRRWRKPTYANVCI